ncbi:hypothetical protein J7I44_11625 [Frateuria sp. MAH-13]|uniref:Uncharacterized protein n=1 Tax=Frateuria flava TaxID=2821489 RepID=A0ABS4DPG7_9GAMM|nr:hypothetical protein [Frateuria flava]MBP1474951.1 hypothetical protein [Frateuria flava]
MHPILERAADAYRPLAGRNRLVEGPHPLPSSPAAPPRRRMALWALVATMLGRRP